jgi:hypothetical protein
MVKSKVWNTRFRADLAGKAAGKGIVIKVAPREINAAVGYRQVNRKYLETLFTQVKFIADGGLAGSEYHVDYC